MSYGTSFYGSTPYGQGPSSGEYTGPVLASSILSAEAFGLPLVASEYALKIFGDGPLRYFRMEETSGAVLYDAMGNGNATIVGSPDFSQPGWDGNAIAWGDGDYASFTRPVQDDFSIEFWIKTSATTNDGTHWYSGAGIVDGEVGGVVPDFGVSQTGSNIAFGIGGDFTIKSGTINDDNWHHVVATRDQAAQVIRLWVDGTQVASQSSTGNSSLTAPTVLVIGSQHSLGGATIDEIAVYDYVLTQSQIEDHFGSDPVMTIEPNSIGSAEAFGSPSIVGGNVFITANGIPSEEAFGSASLINEGFPQTIDVTAIASGEAFGGATLIGPDQLIQANGIASVEAFGVAEIIEGIVSISVGTGIPSAEAMGTPTAIIPGNRNISANSVVSQENFGTPSIFPGNITIIAFGIPSQLAFGVVTILPGGVDIDPTSIPSAEAFGNAELEVGPVFITLIGIPSVEAFGDPNIIRELSNFDILKQNSSVIVLGQTIGIRSLDQRIKVISLTNKNVVVDVVQGLQQDETDQDIGVG